MNGSRPPLFVAAVFAKVFTIVLAVAVAGLGVAIWVQGSIAARDVAGTLISAVIFAYWCRGAIKRGKVCAIKTGILRVASDFCLSVWIGVNKTRLASAEDRALRGRNLSAV